MSGSRPHKVVLLGEGRVGKTSILLRFMRNDFNDKQTSTLSASFFDKTVPIGSGETARMSVWDTAGQERFHALGPLYYRDAGAWAARRGGARPVVVARRGFSLTQHTRDGHDITVPGIVPKLSDTPGSIRSSAPGLGDDTDSVLAGLGLSEAQIQSLRDQKVIA